MTEQIEWRIDPGVGLDTAYAKAAAVILEQQALFEGPDDAWLHALLVVHPDGRTGFVAGLDEAVAHGPAGFLLALSQISYVLPLVACALASPAWEISSEQAVEGMGVHLHPGRREVVRIIATARGGLVRCSRALVTRSDGPPTLGDFQPLGDDAGGWLVEALKGVVEL